MGGNWVVQEGYLQFKFDGAGHSAAHDAVAKALHRASLVERYFVVYMNRKMEIFSDSSREKLLGACYLRGFCGWDGDGLLKAGEAYGLELKLDKHKDGRMFVAAFNRLDVEKWCRAFLAVVDPESAAGQEVRREHRKLRKEEKRAQEEKEEKIRQWKEQQKKLIEDEKRRLQEREEEILNMTPLERIDGLGSLDDDTARMLEKRRQRLQRRQAPTTRRVNKAAYRQRLGDAAGGKLENVQPLQARVVSEQRAKVRVEPPPPGQFIEIAGSARRHSNPAHRRRLESTDGSGSDDSSVDSRMSSGPFSTGSMSNGIPPPPPPPPMSDFDDSRSDFTPPPPPPIPSNRRQSRAHSVRGSLYDDDDRHSVASSRMSHSSRRLSGVDRDKYDAQASLAAILGGRSAPPRADSARNRRDSFESTADSTANGDFQPSHSRGKKAEPPKTEPSMTNAFAASLAAIRRNRADTMDDGSVAASPPPRKRDRKRDSQLSAEGKAMLQKALPPESQPASNKKGGRKGLFDDSSSEDGDSDTGLFGVRKQGAVDKRERPSNERGRPTAIPARVNRRGHDSDESEDESVDDSMSFRPQSVPSEATSPRSIRSSVSANNALMSSRPQSVEVLYKSCVLETQGKKSVPVYTFAFRSGDAEQSFSRSYDEFDGIHDRLASDKSLRLPKFPSKHLLRNNSKPENMQKRAIEFVQYFQELVAAPAIFDNKRFLFEYQISDDFLQSMRGVNTRPTPSSARATPTASRTPTTKSRPAAASASKASNGGAYRSTALFGADDTDSDADSVVGSVMTPQKPTPKSSLVAPQAEPKKKKKTKPSRTDFDDENAASPSVARRDRARSRNSVASNMTDRQRGSKSASKQAEPAEPPIPKITGLPARPNLFGGGRGDLLAAIRQGAALKKVDDGASPAAPSAVTARKSAMLPPPPPPPPAPLTNAGSVAEAITNAMAARRIHVEYEDKSDSDSDDDWDD